MAQAFAFLLFRVFDILKPQPIRYFDARIKNGFGVMFDDVVAAFYTLMVFAIWMRIF
jgi:phosphatidylglycerophosphatase A